MLVNRSYLFFTSTAAYSYPLLVYNPQSSGHDLRFQEHHQLVQHCCHSSTALVRQTHHDDARERAWLVSPNIPETNVKG